MTKEQAVERWNRRAPGWRPISEAPRDGTWIDIWAVQGDNEGFRFADCMWKEATPMMEAGWQGINEGWVPTHFQPLPLPPEEKKI